MDPTPIDKLITALRETGLWSSDQAARALAAALSAIRNPVDLADKVKSFGPLTSYQVRKIKAGRAVDLTMGPFIIQEKIGEGGMGKVYKAFSAKHGKHVALKVVRAHLVSNKTVLKRYQREAAAAAAMDHPNIVSLYEADEADGRYYLAMEYVEGADLSRLIKENGSLPYQEAAEYIRQSALGLQHAHQRGLIHRDIKPSNLLVSGERALPGTDGIAHVKILDMGLVRSILDDPVGTELTRDGTVVGTPDYMAPEQAKNSSKVDARADLYSLGCTLYYCLRAQPLFPEGSPIDKLLRHQLDPPPDIRKARPETPPGLAKVLEKLLKKNPNERYQTATEVAVALQPFTAAADAGIVFAPAAEEPGGVQLDLPSGEAPPPVYDAEVITDVKPILTAEVLPAKPPAKPKKRESKRIVRPITASTDPNSGSMPGQDATRPAGTTPTRVARTPEATKSTTGRPVYPRSPAKQDPRKLWLAIGLTALAAVVLIGGAILLFSKFGSRTRASKSVERPALFVPNG